METDNINNANNINSDRQNNVSEQQKQSLTFIEKILTFSVNKKASDVHLKVNSAPIFRINGELVVQPAFGV